MFSKLAQIRILGQPTEIAITERQSLIKSGCGPANLTDKRATASEIVKGERIAWFEPRKPLIYSEAVLELSAPGIMASEKLEGFDKPGIPSDDTLQKGDFDIQFPCRFAGCFVSGAALSRHTTA
jgi:hypothetical protein